MLDKLVTNCFLLLMNDLPIIKEDSDKKDKFKHSSNLFDLSTPEFLVKKTNLIKVLIDLLSFVET